MFQSFDSKTSAGKAKERLADLRNVMRKHGADWFLVPHSDEHQNEYLPERAERLAFLTGFTGSAGFALVGLETAFLFVDGRYTYQAGQQTDPSCFTLKDLIADAPSAFARTVIRKGEIIAFDPWLLTISQHETWAKLCKAAECKLSSSTNLVDEIWSDQPAPPKGRAWLHPIHFSGRSTEEKLSELKAAINIDKADYLLLTDPASIAWAFNIRGNDLIHNPLALGWAIIPADEQKPLIFMNETRFSKDDAAALFANADLHPMDSFADQLAQRANKKSFHCDPALVAHHLGRVIVENNGTLIKKRDPVILLRAVKNEVELEGARNAHIRDGVAMVRFLAWLDHQTPGKITEIDAAKQLETFRALTAKEMGSALQEISFDTISGAGPNGAIVHYRVTNDTNATLMPDSLYLVDSGGQYFDGTTDITRTIAIGTPPPQAVEDNTLVLKGHIAIAQARFPKGTRGVDLDALARMPLWQKGKDYAHGTGHGIGSFLNVHEGPQSLSKRGIESFVPGMILSNEPGYYREGHYGIRIENLLIVTEEMAIKNGDKPMMGFETITLCPIDVRLIKPEMLNKSERDWLNQYHATVCYTLSPHLASADKEWLKAATRAI
jgi:Xaa-Pro aminopeptidase